MAILTRGGITVLDGTAIEIHGIGFAGVKGFCGGFGRKMLEPWGEPIIKAYVREAVDETLKLETALAKLRTPRRVAVLHYAPIEATVEGEPKEIYPFLGSSRLEDHAHRGAPEGKTRAGVPVHNVAMPLLRRHQPEQPPIKIVTISAEPPVDRRSNLPPTPFVAASP